MSIGDFLSIHPSELKFPFELKKQSTCCFQLANKTDQYVAFKVKTTNPKKYCVRPNAGIVLPNSVCSVTVTMQAPKESPSDMQCRDKFLVQSVIAPNGATNKDFNREDGKVVDEFRLRVIYIPANPPSPVPEGDEEATSPGTSSAEDEINKPALSEVARSLKQPMGNSSSESWTALVSKLNEEKDSIIKQNQKLVSELEFMRNRQVQRGGVSFGVLIFGLLLGILVGYLIRK
ncbi:vesicle-associated protein 1-3 [Phtheirospermum japonicum]|uniref:Vesicle-associated protein 1-3 n=1 Tax=Phtheirospermum japonicum TaxID=374723 RepID=A0A830CE67_9LAMI|nr:vesicle-associated protein 1-3 [Phtheirospermum japonicum]